MDFGCLPLFCDGCHAPSLDKRHREIQYADFVAYRESRGKGNFVKICTLTPISPLIYFVPCDGRLIPISQNTALYSLLGTTFGGNGYTTFALPDLRGRVPVGVSPGNPQYEIGVAGGQESVTLNSSQLPSHSHSITVAPNSTGANQALSNQQPYLALNIGIQGGGTFSSTGWIRVFPYNFTPSGFYPCTGGLEQISSNETLFAQIGTTFGGNGNDTFGLPDLRGRSLLGSGAGAGLTSRQIGESSGASSLTLTASQLPSHSHALAVGTTGITGSDTALNKTQPSLALKPMIAMQGIYGGIGSPDPALGEVRFFAQSSTTTGFVNCDGALKSISQYTALFSLFGTAFGGNGTQNFALPDLQGHRAVSTGQGVGLTNRAMGQKWGTETITLTTAQMPVHTHTAPAPTAPTNVVATAGNGQASLTFTPPSDNGGSAITSYTATSNPGGLTGTSVGAATAITVTGLANGTAYTFTVAASNAIGTSLTTGTSNSVLIPYALTYTAGANGTLSGIMIQLVLSSGSGTAVTAVPATGYRFVNWSDSSTTNPRTDTNVTANKSVTANFTAGYTLTAAAGANSPAPVDTTNPSLALNWMICLSGVYPDRDGGGAVSSADGPYLGEIRCVTFDSLIYFVPCDGRLIPISQNTALYSLLGTTFGGNGYTTFALPDLRGRVPVGVSPGNPQYEIGVAGGQESVTLNSSQLPSHSHSITVAPNSTGANQALSNQQPYLALNIGIQGGGTFSSTGWIRVFPYNFTPSGFYPCTGGLEQISSNETLFAQIGTTFGGNGNDTFGLPDLRGRSLLGSGAGAGLTSRQIGESSGASSLTLTASQLPSHSHALAVGTTGITGSDTALNKTQPSLALKPMIAMQGIYGGIGSPDPALGEVRFFAQSSTTTGFVNCDGALKSISQYTALFSLFGTAFGGNGTQNFALPDLQGHRAVSTGQGVGLTNRAMGQKWGTETITLTTAQMPVHTHTAPAPTAPTNVVATAGNGQASLTFTPPSDNGGSAITSYTATSNPGGLTGTSVGAATAITVTGLANGTAYTFTVAASNAIGTSLTTGTSNSVLIPYALTYTAGANGTLSGIMIQLVLSSGSGTAVTAVPATGYRFVNWSDSSTTNPRTDTNVTANKSVTANFALDNLDTWRIVWYGPGATNNGNAANTADPYHTGIPNLLVYAFFGPNQNPATAQIRLLPQVTVGGGFLSYHFSEPGEVSGLSYGAEWSTALQAGDWQAVTDTSVTPREHLFSVPMDGARKFLRLVVTPTP